MDSALIILAKVPEEKEHVLASVRRRGKVIPLARLARGPIPEPGTGFLHLEWLVDYGMARERKLRMAVEDSLAFLLSLDPLPDFWSYLIHHCSTTSNFYATESGGVFWQWQRSIGDACR